jgi:hypothetical protein
LGDAPSPALWFIYAQGIIKVSAPFGDEKKISTAEHAETAERFLQKD